MSRTSQSLKNIITGIGSQIFLAAVSFFTTRVIKFSLGFEYLGLNGVFNNIISFMSLTELGIGGAIVFALYKPLAENDTHLISILMNFYKKAYRIISMVVFIIGLIILPFLKFFIHTTLTINYVRGVFLLFVLNSSASYLLSYKRSLIFADQKNYIITLYTLIFSFISKVGQLVIFIITKSYVLYLCVNILCTILLNLLLSIKADKMYPFLKEKVNEKLPDYEKQLLISKIKALFLHSIGGYIVFSTDNILISYFVGVSEVGRYSSYIMIITLINTLLTQLYDGISSSVGNFLVQKTKEEKYELYKKIEFINSILNIFITVCLAVLLSPFITVWLGADSILPEYVVYLIVISNFLTVSRKPIISIKYAAGLVEQDKYAPLVESFINLIASIILAHFIGLPGIVIGTILSTLSVPIWLQSKIVFNYVFEKKSISYLLILLRDFFISIIIVTILRLITNHLFVINQFISLIFYFIISGFSCILLECLIFCKNKNWKLFLSNIKNVVCHKKD